MSLAAAEVHIAETINNVRRFAKHLPMPLHPVWHRLHACGHQKLFHKTPSSAANTIYKKKKSSWSNTSKVTTGIISSEIQRWRRSGRKKQGTVKLFFVDQLWGCLGIRWDTALSLSGANILERATFIYTCCTFFTFLAVYLSKWFWPKYWLSIPSPESHPPEREAEIYLTWRYTCAMCYKTLRVIRMKFLLIISML